MNAVRGVTVICPACRTPYTALHFDAIAPCASCGHPDTQILAIVRDVERYGFPRTNPPKRAKRILRRRRNAPVDVQERAGVRRASFRGQQGHLVSRRVLELAYFNIGSVQRTPYKHEFESDGVELWALADGSLLLKHPRYRLWEDFVVPDNE